MTRCLFAILSAVSLLLCVATCVLWVRSYHVRLLDHVFIRTPGGRCDIYSFAGRVWGIRVGGVTVLSQGLAHPSWLAEDLAAAKRIAPGYGLQWAVNDHPWTNAGFEMRQGGESFGIGRTTTAWIRVSVATVPHWVPVLMTAVGPAVWFGRPYWPRRRRRPGLCPACGYDLRATPGRCPECGAMPAGSGE